MSNLFVWHTHSPLQKVSADVRFPVSRLQSLPQNRKRSASSFSLTRDLSKMSVPSLQYPSSLLCHFLFLGSCHRNRSSVMSYGQEFVLSDFPRSAPRSMISSESHGEESSPNPFAHQADNFAENQPPQGYDPAASNLLANPNEKQYSQNPFAFHNWAWEFAAWILAAVSLLSLFVVLAHFHGKPLREWQSTITPSTVVAIVSQIGQSAAIFPVSACVCQSMWLWLDRGSNLRGHHPQLTATQNFDNGSRGPLGGLVLLWKQPTSYEMASLSTFMH